VARYLVGMTGASGAAFGVDFIRRCPGDKFLVMSDWARHVLQTETGLKPADLEPHVRRMFADSDLAAPFSSGSNRYDAYVVVPCSSSTLAKIASGISDTLITRAAAVALKERLRLVLCVRETPFSSIALDNALKLSRGRRRDADLAALVSHSEDGRRGGRRIHRQGARPARRAGGSGLARRGARVTSSGDRSSARRS
jgi:4-hydroxy-3-polyprenylbenzoate decarboxylase